MVTNYEKVSDDEETERFTYTDTDKHTLSLSLCESELIAGQVAY